MDFRQRIGDWIEKCDPSKIIVLDTETTGVDKKSDELLQVSIIDGYGNTLLDTYVKPLEKKIWEGAMKVNHISPEMVENAPTIKDLAPKILEIVNGADKVITYNGEFDLAFLNRLAGVELKEDQEHIDTMFRFSKFKGDWSNYYHSYKWYRLTDVAEMINFDFSEEDAHNSLGDVKATLWLYYFLEFNKNKGIKNYDEFVKRYRKPELEFE